MEAACSSGRVEVVRYLLGAGEAPSKALVTGNSPLHFAAFHGMVNVVEELLKLPGLERQIYEANAFGEIPLMLAVKYNRKAVVKELLYFEKKQRKADSRFAEKFPETQLQVRSIEGMTALQLARDFGRQTLTKLLGDNESKEE